MRLVLFAERHFRGLIDEGREDYRELNRPEHVQIEWLHCDIVQSCNLETCLLAHFAHCPFFRTLIIPKASVNRFPGTRTSGVIRALNRENLPSVRKGTNDVDIDDSRDDL